MKTLSMVSLLLVFSCSFGANRELASVAEIYTVEELKERISNAQDGETLILDAQATFNLSSERPIKIAKSIIIKSSDANKKPHLFHHKIPQPVFEILADKVRFEGLKISGRETDTKLEEIMRLNAQGIRGVYQFPVTRGIDIKASGVTIKDCELSGFSHSAIFIENAHAVQVSGNYIHHNQRSGLGYGVVLNLKSDAFITRNQFNFNRHSVAGSGHSGQSYEASYNWFGPNHIGSTLDMHGGKDRKDGTNVAGTTVLIHHNMIKDKNNPIFTHRGIPLNKVHIHNNVIFRDSSSAVDFVNGIKPKDLSKTKFLFEANRFVD